MSWATPRRVLIGLSLLLVSLAIARPVPAEMPALPPAQAPEAWLVTYGPGDIYWQRFGHNAIWLREPGGLDHAFNFGFFDFEQQSFLKRFVQGRMLYFAAAVPTERELAFYASEGREIRVQRLDLSPASYARLREHLLWHIEPEHREYRYDYFLDNCSTRLRDALDLALDGRLRERFSDQSADQNLRAHTRRSTQADRDFHLGLVAALGTPVDRPISRWDEMFLPAVLADALAGFIADTEADTGAVVPVGRSPGAGRLVVEDRVLVPGSLARPPATPGRTWPLYAALGSGLAALGLLAARARRPVLVDGPAMSWLLVAGTLGVGLLLVWGFTDHAASHPNANLLLLNPLALLGLVPRLRKITGWVLLLSTFLAAVLAAWPGGQYLADTLAFITPLNLVVAGWLLRSGRQNA